MRDHQSIKKILDYHLFWYDFSLVDSCGYGTFNGVPAFISILYGYCKLKGKTAAQPVLVRVFKHPEPGMENAFRYSFAVLVEMYGTFSDASGWLIFNDCATDFSGTGGALHDQAMEWINKMETEGLCKSEAIEIDSEMFDWYIKEYRFERRMAIHDARTEIDSRDGISTSIFENFISERESSNSLMKNSRSVNVLESERQQIAEEIVLNVGHVNLIISRISKDDFKFIVLDPMLSLRFAIPCEDEKDFSNRIGYLSRSFTSECEPMRRLLEKSESDWKSIRLLEEWNRSKNGGKIPQTVIELWQKIMRVRNNMPSYHDQKTEYIELVEFFKIKFPIDYAKFWDEIMIRFSDSLLDFMKSMN
jgi:hypothetical protein